MRNLDQTEVDQNDRLRYGVIAKRRPGDIVKVRGIINKKKGPTVSVVVINSRVAGRYEEILAASVEYGKRWFREKGSSFQIVSES